MGDTAQTTDNSVLLDDVDYPRIPGARGRNYSGREMRRLLIDFLGGRLFASPGGSGIESMLRLCHVAGIPYALAVDNGGALGTYSIRRLPTRVVCPDDNDLPEVIVDFGEVSRLVAAGQSFEATWNPRHGMSLNVATAPGPALD